VEEGGSLDENWVRAATKIKSKSRIENKKTSRKKKSMIFL
jgi:hypothetical protein